MSEYHQHSDLSLLPELKKLDGPGFDGFVALTKRSAAPTAPYRKSIASLSRSVSP